jgi:hypothetical protein
MNVGVPISLRQGLAQNVVARVITSHIQFGVKNEGIDKSEGERKECGYFEALHSANLAH